MVAEVALCGGDIEPVGGAQLANHETGQSRFSRSVREPMDRFEDPCQC